MTKRYTVKLNRYDVEKAARKLIVTETGYDPDNEDDSHMLEHTHFYNIILISAEFECDEGSFEWTYIFEDNGSLHDWGS